MLQKTKTLSMGEQQTNSQPPIMLHSQPLEEVESFSYPGNEIGHSSKAAKEVSVTLEKTGKVHQIW